MSGLWHNLVVHPLCGLLWLGPKRTRAFADRWHERTGPDAR